MKVRIQKAISSSGIASRRKAEMLVKEGRVTVNGQKITNYLNVLKDVKDIRKFSIYLDLRRRGYYVKIVREGPIDLLVWERGKSPTKSNPSIAIKIVDEGRGIKTTELIQLLKHSESMGLQLVLALMSSEGTITYYKAYSFKVK